MFKSIAGVASLSMLTSSTSYNDIDNNTPNNMRSVIEDAILEAHLNLGIEQTILMAQTRNPTNYDIIRDASEIATSVIKDDRTTVTLSDAFHNASGRILINDQFNGSGTVIKNPYDPDNIYILTAGHVLTDYTGTIKDPSDTVFVTDYIGDNQLLSFQSSATAIVVKESGNYKFDTAIIKLRADDLPEEIVPVGVNTDFHTLNISAISSSGYSQDREGLTEHTNCSLTAKSPYRFLTNCDFSSGASGGLTSALINGERMAVAVNSYIENPSKLSGHHTVDNELLQSAANLTYGETKNITNFYGCIEVFADTLNVRAGPSVDYPILGSRHKGEKTQVLGRGGDWLEVFTDTTKGYIHKDYTRQSPCN